MADEIIAVSPGVFFWQAYDPQIKAELFSTALQSASGIVIIDPIPLKKDQLEGLCARGPIAGIFVTNENHDRAAAEFAARLEVPIHDARGIGSSISSDLTAIPIAGGPCGETALHLDRDGGTLVIGDALINFDPYGFTFLPPKYCSDAKLMRESLSTLLEFRFERMLFAHGTPLVSAARPRLEELLKSQG
jgi:hypothetical protein